MRRVKVVEALVFHNRAKVPVTLREKCKLTSKGSKKIKEHFIILKCYFTINNTSLY
jgi:hypothetical protein